MSQSKEAAHERRQLHRSQQMLRVQWSILDANQLDLDPYADEFALPAYFHLAHRMLDLDAEQRHLLRTINSESRATAQYLQVLDRKLHLLASSLIPDLPGETALARNISEGGLSLQFPQALPVGQGLHLLLQSHDASLCISATGRVVHVRHHGGDYTLGIEFVALREPDRQAICRLVIRQAHKE
ncbi:MAG: PilZ domain-containing protein [Pseudomonadales bacterium]|nr:PilZ domain-containing protein [Pseudomonadales bacterium]